MSQEKASRQRAPRWPAGQASDGIVAVSAPTIGGSGQLVHHFGESRQMLADLDSRDGWKSV